MRVLLVYYSFTQNNEMLAKMIQSRLGCELFKIETVRKRSTFSIFLDAVFGRRPAIRKRRFSMSSFDHCIFVAPIWFGKIAGPMLTFLRRERARITSYSFISLCGGLAGQREKIESQLNLLMETPPVKVSELWISEIVDKNVPKDARHISAYRVKADEMKKFETKIEQFCFGIVKEKALKQRAMVASNL